MDVIYVVQDRIKENYLKKIIYISIQSVFRIWIKYTISTTRKFIYSVKITCFECGFQIFRIFFIRKQKRTTFGQNFLHLTYKQEYIHFNPLPSFRTLRPPPSKKRNEIKRRPRYGSKIYISKKLFWIYEYSLKICTVKFLSRRRKKAGDFHPHKITILTASSRRKKYIHAIKSIYFRGRTCKFIIPYVSGHMDIDILYLSIWKCSRSRDRKNPSLPSIDREEKATFQLQRNGLSDWNKAKSEESRPGMGKKNDMSGIFARNWLRSCFHPGLSTFQKEFECKIIFFGNYYYITFGRFYRDFIRLFDDFMKGNIVGGYAKFYMRNKFWMKRRRLMHRK